MERVMKKNAQMGIALAILLVALPTTLAGPEIPADKSAVSSWFSETIKPLESRKSDMDVNLATAEASPVVIKVRIDGSGQFKKVQEAIDSVKAENTVRTIIDIGPGVYKERIKVERFKPYITFLGDAEDRPTLSADGTNAKYGTVYSGTVTVEADYFVASNIIFENSAPRPTKDTVGGQALAIRIMGDKATFYNCRFLGFQDTLCDDKGKHFYKDCYIEGTVDFIFGSGQTIYLNTEIHVFDGESMAMITAHSKNNEQEEGGYVFIHGTITGKGGMATLGRTWMPAPKVMFFCIEMGDAVNEVGWSNNQKPDTEKTSYFAEWKNTGPKSDLSKRVSFMKKFEQADAKPYITLDYIEGMKWILPPPGAKGAAATSTAPGATPSEASGAPKSGEPSAAPSASTPVAPSASTPVAPSASTPVAPV